MENNKIENNKIENNKMENNKIENNKIENNKMENNKMENNKKILKTKQEYKIINKKQKNKKLYNNNKNKTKIKKFSNVDLNLNLHLNNHKESIPKRIRELVWTTYNNETFTHKCFVSWCENKVNVFNFQVGHDIPESKGGTLDIDNLKPICGNCNLSMGNKYTITEWCKLVIKKDDNIIIKSLIE